MTTKSENKIIRRLLFRLIDNFTSIEKKNNAVFLYYHKQYGVPYSSYNYHNDKIYAILYDDPLFEYFEEINADRFIETLSKEQDKNRFINCYNEVNIKFLTDNPVELNTIASGFNIPHKASVNNYNRGTLTVNVYKEFFFNKEDIDIILEYSGISINKDIFNNDGFISIQELSNNIHNVYSEKDLIQILENSTKKIKQNIIVQSKEETLESFLENIAIENEEDLELISRTLREQNIIDRDRSIVKRLKIHYENKCQLCETQIILQDGRNYSEVHHLHPLGENGFDLAPNMIVVCPNCHVELDFGKAISKDDIYIKEPHFIDDKCLEYQNSKIEDDIDIEQYNKEIDESMLQYKNGNYKTQEEMQNHKSQF